ncbi:MAG: hypothetical protein ACRD0K_04415 [Egibacteraceae bacterium]
MALAPAATARRPARRPLQPGPLLWRQQEGGHRGGYGPDGPVELQERAGGHDAVGAG